MNHQYKTRGTCSREISFDLQGETIHNVQFTSGCAGNLAGISKLVEGRQARDIIALFKGTPCGGKPTSCPDQLALALEEALAKEA